MSTHIDPQSDLRALTTTKNGITYSLCSGGQQLVETTSIDVQDMHPGVTSVMDFRIHPREYDNTYKYVNVLGTYRVLGTADKKMDKKQLLDRIEASASVPVHGAIIDIAAMRPEERQTWNFAFGRDPMEDRPIYAEYTQHIQDSAANALSNARPEAPAFAPIQAIPQAGTGTITQSVPGSGYTLNAPAPIPGSGYTLNAPVPIPGSGYTLNAPAPVPGSAYTLNAPAPIPGSGYTLNAPVPIPGSGYTLNAPAPAPATATATTRPMRGRGQGGTEIPISASEWYEMLGSWLGGASYHELCAEYCPDYHTAGHKFSDCDACTRYKQRTHYFKRVKKMGKNSDGTRWVDDKYLEEIRLEAEAEGT